MDALAALRASEIDVEIGDYVYTIPALDAVDWLEVLGVGGMGAVIPGLLHPDDRVALLREYLVGTVTAQDMLDASHRVIEAAGGRKWWIVLRLVANATDPDAWPTVHGTLLKWGVRVQDETLAGLCNVVWVLILSSYAKEEERQQAEFKLTAPPSGYLDEVETTDEAEFMAMLEDQNRLTG